jgi:hypothetical protein
MERRQPGVTWEPMTPEAPWAPRAGAAAVVKDDAIYLLGGEDGFTCGSGPRCPPYFNDVWRTQDGIEWELVTESADWVARPGHQAVVLEDEILVFGGFGLSTDPADPFKASNPMDMWASKDGENWDLLEQIPWNAESAADIKYDFAALTATSGPDGRPAVFTFGGDRETFNPFDPLNYLNVDNDVWRYEVPEPSSLLMTIIGIVASMSMLRRRQRAHDKGVMRY